MKPARGFGTALSRRTMAPLTTTTPATPTTSFLTPKREQEASPAPPPLRPRLPLLPPTLLRACPAPSSSSPLAAGGRGRGPAAAAAACAARALLTWAHSAASRSSARPSRRRGKRKSQPQRFLARQGGARGARGSGDAERPVAAPPLMLPPSRPSWLPLLADTLQPEQFASGAAPSTQLQQGSAHPVFAPRHCSALARSLRQVRMRSHTNVTSINVHMCSRTGAGRSHIECSPISRPLPRSVALRCDIIAHLIIACVAEHSVPLAFRHDCRRRTTSC